jgi:hypothetical protein
VVQFNADIADGMPWKFVSTQREVCLYLIHNLTSYLGTMVVKIPILILKSYDFTIRFALSDYEYTYNPIFVESGGIPI